VGLYMMAGGVTIAAVAAFLVIVFHHPTKDMENAVPSGRLSVPSPSATPTLAPPVDATAKVAEPPRPEQHLSSPAPERQPQGSDESAALPDPASTNLTVTGIAWQEEKYARRAVVNGTLLGEGSVIAGARIVEIKEDRVRFSIGGRTMEVLLSSALQNTH